MIGGSCSGATPMRKWLAIATAAVVLPTLHAQGLQQTAQPQFEVASLKENTSNDGMVAIQTQKGRYTARGFTLAALIRNAYRVQEFQIIGGPDWINTDRFDVEAVFPDADRARVDLMLRALLAERFKLAVHNEKQERPIYALTFARADKRLGPQLEKSTTDC